MAIIASTTAMSCTIRMPTAMRPCRESSSRRSESSLMMMMVLEKVSATATYSAVSQSRPRASTITKPIDNRECQLPESGGEHHRSDVTHMRQIEPEPHQEQQHRDTELCQQVDLVVRLAPVRSRSAPPRFPPRYRRSAPAGAAAPRSRPHRRRSAAARQVRQRVRALSQRRFRAGAGLRPVVENNGYCRAHGDADQTRTHMLLTRNRRSTAFSASTARNLTDPSATISSQEAASSAAVWNTCCIGGA